MSEACPMRALIASIVTLLLIASLPAVAMAGESGMELVVTSDTRPDGTTVAKSLNHFGYVLFDDEGEPAFHHDAQVTVRFDGEVLYQTEPSTGHDYDGVDQVQVSFPGPGSYSVTATVETEEGTLTDTFNGTVLPSPDTQVQAELDVPAEVTVGEPLEIGYRLVDQDGELVPHASLALEIEDTELDRLVMGTTLHGHDGTGSFTYAFPQARTYELTAVATVPFFGDKATATTSTETVHEIQATGSLPASQAPGTTSRAPLENTVDSHEADPYELVATYDPYTSIPVDGRIQLSTLTLDAGTGQPVAHVDYAARLTGPQGQVLFETSDGHEYDGILEVVHSFHQVGDLTLEVTAMKEDWESTISQTFSVLPPTLPLAAGPQFVEMTTPGELTVGQPSQVELYAHDEADRPFAHSELTLTLRDEATGHRVLHHKVHTHDDGRFPVTLNLAQIGDYSLEVDGVDLEPTAAGQVHGPTADQPPIFALSASAPDAPQEDGVDRTSEPGTDTVPGPGLVASLMAGLLAILVARRA